MLTLSINQPAFQAQVRELLERQLLAAEEIAVNILTQVGIETVAYLRSLTDEMNPPWPSRKGPERPAHPGHWSDRTGQLAAGYDAAVEKIPGGARLTLSNFAEYAVYLEARNGYFVLSGVTDPGGPVEEQLRRAVAAIAPGWTVTAQPWARMDGQRVVSEAERIEQLAQQLERRARGE